MNRSMWTAATGMGAQQLNIDVIANNLANVNTTGFKAERLEFKDLMYQQMKIANRQDEVGRPVNLEVGHGVMSAATMKKFENGSLLDTGNTFDVALVGENAFFEIQLPNGESRYTRDGSFKFSLDGEEITLTTSEGYTVLNNEGEALKFETNLKDYSIDEAGNITAKNATNESVALGQLRVMKFNNTKGLAAQGANLYASTVASGEALPLGEGDRIKIVSGYLESSNVRPVEEMVKLISAQRAYELTSKAITTSDEMLQIANNLRR